MSLFSDQLRDNIDTSCILLCGDSTDQIISKDLCLREFSVALADILREHGFDNIVFYDCTNAMGKYVYDDQSAYYSIQGAKDVYRKKYSSIPGGNTPTVPEPPQKSPATVGFRFGAPRKAVTSLNTASPVSIHPEPIPPSGPSRPQTTDEIQYQQKNLVEAVFYGECQDLMNQTSFRSAIVFTNINNLLKLEDSMTRYVEVIHNYWRKNNLLIFIHPDLSIRECTEFYSQLKQCGLLEYFYTPGKCTGEYLPNPGRVFRIQDYGRDEVQNLLLLHQIFDGLKIPGGIAAASEKIHYMLRSLNQKSGRAAITVRSLHKRINRYVATHPAAVVDNAFLESVLEVQVADFDFKPWETLRHRHGWESVVQSLETLLEDRSLLGQDYASEQPSTSLLVTRIGGDELGHFPPASKLPHLILEGSPGTGKTTIVKQIGRIMHDEGLLSVGHVVQAYRSDLIADVIGGTAIKVQRILDSAENGILFIDEAYDLCKDYDSGGNAGTFAEEAVNTLVNAMTDDSRHVLVVFAGYKCSSVEATDGVQGLFKMNPGLESRIKRILSIPDYTPDVLTEIFFDIIGESGYSLADDLSRSDIATYMRNVYQSRNRKTFGNGRFVRENLIERKLIPAASRRGSRQIARCDFGEDAACLEQATMESVRKELDEYPGLGAIGIQIISDYINYREMLIHDGVELDKIENMQHLIFSGNPGTGKTTIAKLLSRALGVANIMSGAPPVVITNPEKVTLAELDEKIRDAVNFNTLLFIDEAHNCPEEFIHTLLNPMSENKKLTCVFAVYRDRYEEFLRKDNGLKRRCRQYTIEDYTPKELLEIFLSLAEKQGRTCSVECVNRLKVLFQNWYDTRTVTPDYGNASDVELLLRQMKENCYKRTKSPGHSTEERHLMSEQDIPQVHRDIIDAQGRKRDIDEILKELETFVGWEELKDWIKETWREVQYQKKRPNHLIRRGHMRFVGAPGTGKTTAGKLFADACYAMGLISSNRFKYCTAKDLIAGYLGQTHEKTAKALDEGRNGVIFIDEAYGLTYREDSSFGVDYKKEAVEYLLAFTEQELSTTIVIVAGYERLIDEMIASNPGLPSRFPFTIHFPNYTPEECVLILSQMLKDEGQISEAGVEKAARYFAKYSTADNFSNARDVRNICDQIKSSHINRVLDQEDPPMPDIFTIDDVAEGFEHWAHNNGF